MPYGFFGSFMDEGRQAPARVGRPDRGKRKQVKASRKAARGR